MCCLVSRPYCCCPVTTSSQLPSSSSLHTELHEDLCRSLKPFATLNYCKRWICGLLCFCVSPLLPLLRPLRLPQWGKRPVQVYWLLLIDSPLAQNIFNFFFLFISVSSVCFRIISSVMDSSLTKAGKASQSYDRYCSLTSIPVEETQFCYNTNGIKAEIHRLLDLGANAERICKKVNKVNPDFCTTKESDFVLTALENPDSDALLTNNTNFKAKRGFIYI